MLFIDNSGFSNYHSLQLSLTRRIAPVVFLLGYTWSKSMDNESGSATPADRSARGGGGEELSLAGLIHSQVPVDIKRAVSDFDRTHRLTVSYVIDLPTPEFAQKAALGRFFLGNWSMTGITTFQSGTPYSVRDSGGGSAFGASPNGFALSLANPAHSGPINVNNDNPDQYLNASDFGASQLALGGGPGDTEFGVLGRNIFRSPFQQNWDCSLTKRFLLSGESKQLNSGLPSSMFGIILFSMCRTTGFPMCGTLTPVWLHRVCRNQISA